MVESNDMQHDIEKRVEVKRKYDVIAKSYDELYSEEQGMKYLASWNFIKKSHGLILDAGCGTGLFEDFLISSGSIDNFRGIICLDISEGMISIAKDKANIVTKLDEKVEYMVADIGNMPFRDKSFDFAFSYTVLSLSPNSREDLKELTRVTKGAILISVLKKYNWKVYVSRLREYAKTEKDYIYILEQ